MASRCSKGAAGLLHTHMCQALADPTRLLILYALADQPRLVGELGDALGLPQSSISRHLKVLRDQSLVHARHEGAAVRYSLADCRVIEALDLLRRVVHDSLLEKTRLGDAAAVATSSPAQIQDVSEDGPPCLLTASREGRPGLARAAGPVGANA